MYDELTAKDIQKMEEEIEHRKLVIRKQALEDVKEARAHGDLSENFEYKAAKKFKNENESRIRYLEKMIRTAKVISEESADDEVGMNNTVELYFEEDDEVEIYKVVTTVRSNSLKNLKNCKRFFFIFSVFLSIQFALWISSFYIEETRVFFNILTVKYVYSHHLLMFYTCFFYN